MPPLFFARLRTPIGDQWAVRTPDGLSLLGLPGSQGRFYTPDRFEILDWREEYAPDCRIVEDPDAFADVIAWLDAYFAGRVPRRKIALDMRGTPFQQTVWARIAAIPYGATTTYGSIAKQIGKKPSAARAVGGATGANPVPLIVPCHRVLGENGSLTGFGGGLDLKERLLTLEGVLLL